MKKFKQLVKELPSKKVIMAFGRFQPPTTGHALLVNAVTKLAKSHGADHIIYASRTQDSAKNPLPVDRKVYYLKRMFPRVNFVAANEQIRTFIEAVKVLSTKYKHLIMIAGSDRVPEYKKILEKYNGTEFNFDSIDVVSAGERDPDADNAAGMSGTKMREAAKSGDFSLFKKGLPRSLTALDGKRLMNEIRVGMKLDPISEQIKFETCDTREKYYSGHIFNVGSHVTDGTSIFEVLEKGSNYVTVVDSSGITSKKWLDSISEIEISEDVAPGAAPDQISYKGYVTKNFNRSADAARAFADTIRRAQDPLSILNALKATDQYMGLNDRVISTGKKPTEADMEEWRKAHEKARESLNRIGEFAHHQDYWHMHQHEIEDASSNYAEDTSKEESVEEQTYISKELLEMKFSASDKIKVARIIAAALGLEDVEKSSNAEQLVNSALRKIKSKPMRAEYIDVLKKMLSTAEDAGIKYDEKLVPTKVEEDVQGSSLVLPGSDDQLRKKKIRYHLGEESEEDEDEENDEMDEDEIEDMINGMSDDDYLEAYDDDELHIVDSETGEHVDSLKEEVQSLMEVLSRMERIRAKMRFAKTAAKRERKLQIALHTRSSSGKINQRARRLAVSMMKQKLAKKPLDKLSVGEKERIEKIIERRKQVIGRIAMKLVPKIRKIENDRLSHSKFTK